MAIKTILFDLDGTLLPMDQDVFVKGYFSLLAKKLESHGYEAKSLIDAVWRGTGAMIQNDGSKTNETVFWDKFASILGEHVLNDKEVLEAFYRNEFTQAKQFVGHNASVSDVVKKLKKKGYKLVLATNPIFPAQATLHRIDWAGLHPHDFVHFTSYENAKYSKPNPQYYQEILDKLGLQAEECLMVGNDVVDDTAAAQLGIKVFLLTDCLINKDNVDISMYPQGGFEDLMAYIAGLE